MTKDANDCGCCAGAEHRPGVRFNAPGLPTIDYRIGRHGEFKAALLAHVSSARYPALAGLRTRDDDDFSIALCDAGAVMLDVLSFYQERIANEAYLRTAVERRSVVELARLIGYQPSPGVAASTWLAFTLEDAPGQPALAARPVTIPVGTRAQSVPGADEQPQTFETVEPTVARVEWNAMPAQITERQNFAVGTRELFVAGTSTQVQAGDVIVIVGDERITDIGSERWDARVVTTVEVDNTADRTRLSWDEGLGDSATDPTELNARAYVFRVRAALFGHNAPDPRLLFKDGPVPAGMTSGSGSSLVWANYTIQNGKIDLDSSFPKILAGSWFLLAGGKAKGSPSLPGHLELYRAETVAHLSQSKFAISGKFTRLVPDTDEGLPNFALQTTTVFAHSDELKLIDKPLTYPVYGSSVPLSRRDRHLEIGQPLAVSGKRQRLRIVVDDPALQFQPDGEDAVALKPGDSFVVIAAPAWLLFGVFEIALSPKSLDEALRNKPNLKLRWRLTDRHGRRGTLDATTNAVALQHAERNDQVISELVFATALATAPAHERTTLHLGAPLSNVYDRATVAVCANVAPATHGESVSEVAGSGDAAVADQRFLLKQSPLTYVSASTPNGRRSTLEVRVDGQRWDEVPSLFERGANEHVYALRHDDEQRTIVQFGDGIEAARLPSGRDNLRFGYRKSIGAAGNVGSGQLTTLLGRPLGVKGVNNPVAATGGQDRESRTDARRNAPLTMLTLGRAVSLQDYTDFARSFSGIAKALAAWMQIGSRRGILLSLAGQDGAPVAENSSAFVNLAQALRDYGDPLLPLRLQTFRSVHFRLKAKLKIMPTATADDVLPKVRNALRAHFSFVNRDFAQQVSLDEVMAVIQRVQGVDAVDIDALYRLDPGATPALVARLFARRAQVNTDGSVDAAELLTLDPGPLSLDVMP